MGEDSCACYVIVCVLPSVHVSVGLHLSLGRSMSLLKSAPPLPLPKLID